MVFERGAPLRIIFDSIQGPLSYPPGGFVGGGAVGSNVPNLPGMGTSNLGFLFKVIDAMGQGLVLASGLGAFNSGGVSGILYVVQSAGISGNQVGIRCFNPSGYTSGVGTTSLSGGNTQLAEVQSGANLSPYVFKVLVQGF